MSAERSIMFGAAGVRAILAGTKTQTRRTVKPNRYRELPDTPRIECDADDGLWYCDGGHWMVRCPYGVPGDRLWVRETWADTMSDPAEAVYRADGERHPSSSLRWQSPMRMPRWASRITLEVTGVRVERLHQISAKDILAEGAVIRAHIDQFGRNPVSAFDGCVYLDLMSLWAAGWDKINRKRAPWESNPWVWVIEFKRIEP